MSLQEIGDLQFINLIISNTHYTGRSGLTDEDIRLAVERREAEHAQYQYDHAVQRWEIQLQSKLITLLWLSLSGQEQTSYLADALVIISSAVAHRVSDREIKEVIKQAKQKPSFMLDPEDTSL